MYGIFFPNLSSIISQNVCYPQLSLWILIALAKICFSHIAVKPHKDTSALVGTVVKKSKYLAPESGCAEHMRTNKRRHCP